MAVFMFSKKENQQINTQEQLEKQDSNLVGFFDLLLKIDKRNNPDNYNPQQSHD